MSNNRVCIIGAGASGLISLKIALENNLEAKCFEMSSDIGGLWNYNEEYVSGKGGGSVMRTTVINSSKENMAFSDYPAPKEFANFMHNTKVLEYLRLYAKEFDLLRHIQFKTRILSIRHAADYDTSGNWVVRHCEESEKGDTSNEQQEVFNYVMICIGHHANPYIPIIKGVNDKYPSTFKGEYIHSLQYRSSMSDFNKYLNKRVLVIGVGNSGGDIACELSRICSRVYLSTRSGVWVAPRSSNAGYPTDYTYITRFLNTLETHLPHKLTQMFLHSKLNAFVDHNLYCLRPHETHLRHHIFVNDDLPNRVASGTLIIKSNVVQFEGTNNTCVFDDGTSEEHIDAIILATGYQIGFPLLSESENKVSTDQNWVNLYKYIFPPEQAHATLAIVGCIQPRGAINPIVELQARWICQIFKGERRLPSRDVMKRDILNRQEEIKQTYFTSPRHTIQVEFINYMDELAHLIGCKPNLCKFFWSDPRLWYHLYFKGFVPYQYRLNGPHANAKLARRLILSADERVAYPFKTRKLNENTSSKFFFQQ